MNDPVVVGIDIGGSKTHGVRAAAGETDRHFSCGSANISSVGLTEAGIQLDLLAAELGAVPVAAVCAGAAGVDTPHGERLLVDLIRKRFPHTAHVKVVHDTQLILAAAELDAGAVIISGTGSAAWGCSQAGEQVRASGWGYLLGDVGSGYGVVRAAMRHVLDRYDAAEPHDTLTTAILRNCGVHSPPDLLDLFYHQPSRQKWARRANVVFDLAADTGDQDSTQIIADAADELVRAGTRVCRRLGLTGPVVLAGGLLVHQPALQRAVRSGLSNAGLEDVRLLTADPVHGAVTIARKAAIKRQAMPA